MSGIDVPAPSCTCETCMPQGNPFTGGTMRFIVCAICGNKRCPHATDHSNACTNSNEPGQKGSAWEHVKRPGDVPAPSEREAPLLPCPFCGSPAKLYPGCRGYRASVECTREDCQTGNPDFSDVNDPNHDSAKEAVTSWNRRAALSVPCRQEPSE